MAKKLIEVALPLEVINEQAEREKHITQGHPAVLHLWWARRPLTIARAILWSSLVDDPSSHLELFPTEEEQNRERDRLFKILAELVVWENSNDENILETAKAEIHKYAGGAVPDLLDPFSGGGTIPLEGHRLGLHAHAHDLNPVSVSINKALVEIPSRFHRKQPVNPVANALATASGFEGTSGLTEDVKYYGELLKNKVHKRLGQHYPMVTDPHTKEKMPVVAWIWARTVKCSNPACSCETPLVRSFSISKKRGREAIIEPIVDGKHINYRISKNGSIPKGTVSRTGATCLGCNETIKLDYIRQQGVEGNLGKQLICVIADGKKGKIFLEPTDEQISAAQVSVSRAYTPLPEQALGFRIQAYGLSSFEDLYTDRQYLMMSAFCEELNSLKTTIINDAVQSGLFNDFVGIEAGGSGATAYAEAIIVYLAFAIDKLADYNATSCTWHVNNQQIAHTFGRQAISMTWDYAEANPFSGSSGSFDSMINSLCKSLLSLPSSTYGSVAKQHDAQSDTGLRNVLVSTDPPYYDNIGYADLSDYFYIWLRKNLGDIYPSLFTTMMVPKSEELIANPFRNDNSMDKAQVFFEDGMFRTCQCLYECASDEYPVSIYYAYKQHDTDQNGGSVQTASTGWETMLSAIIRAGFSITGTWPVRTEKTGRLRANESNALASSIVLVCRKRREDARICTRRDFVTALKRELKPALQKLQQSNIAPVDLAQSAIGPGIGVFSRYKKVLEADGSEMTVRSALQIINQELDMYFSGQDSAIDSDSRLCVELFTQYAYNTLKFGDADILARAKGTSVAKLAGEDILYAAKGDVRLLTREEIPERVNPSERSIWKLTQQLTRAMETGGIDACAKIVAPIFGSNAEEAKNLAYRLYSVCERKNWAQEAYAYNALVVAWPEIQSKAAELQAIKPEQMNMFELGGM